MEGLIASLGLTLFLMMVTFAEPNLKQNQIPYALLSKLNKKSRNLFNKVISIKTNFAKSRGVNTLKMPSGNSALLEKEYKTHASCENLLNALKRFQDLFDEAQKMQLSESRVSRNIKAKPTDVFVNDFRHIEFKLREFVSKLRKLSKAEGFKASEIPPYSVGLGPKSVSAIAGKEFTTDEINFINYKQLENIEKCLKVFSYHYLTYQYGENSLELDNFV